MYTAANCGGKSLQNHVTNLSQLRLFTFWEHIFVSGINFLSENMYLNQFLIFVPIRICDFASNKENCWPSPSNAWPPIIFPLRMSTPRDLHRARSPRYQPRGQLWSPFTLPYTVQVTCDLSRAKLGPPFALTDQSAVNVPGVPRAGWYRSAVEGASGRPLLPLPSTARRRSVAGEPPPMSLRAVLQRPAWSYASGWWSARPSASCCSRSRWSWTFSWTWGWAVSTWRRRMAGSSEYWVLTKVSER